MIRHLQREVDVLVIGAGLAGLRAATEARRFGAQVLVVDKGVIGVSGNSAFAGGGFKTCLPGMDTLIEKQYLTPEAHYRDTIIYGDYVSEQPLVEALSIEAPGRVLELEDVGVENFMSLCTQGSTENGGHDVTLAFARNLRKIGVSTMVNTMLVDLLLADGEVCGAMLFSFFSEQLVEVRAKAVILATGGAGASFARNNVSSAIIGDGYATAYRAGAELIGTEFTMFDPYILDEPGLPMWYVLPCYARFCGELVNAQGEEFLPNYLEVVGKRSDPFPVKYGALTADVRETISRAMATEIHEGRGDNGAVFLDCRHVPVEYWDKDVPGRANRDAILRKFPITEKPIRVIPGAITNLGGVRINDRCETSVTGLYAAGEVAGLLNGARRLGGNALTECLVFGARAGQQAAERAIRIKHFSVGTNVKAALGRIDTFLAREGAVNGNALDIQRELKRIGWEGVGPLRSGIGLETMIGALRQIRQNRIPAIFAKSPSGLRAALEAEFMLISHEILANAALARRESRGSHFRLDFPEIDNSNFLKNFVVSKQKGSMHIDEAQIPVTRVPLPRKRHRAFADPSAQSSRPRTERGDGELVWLKEQVPA